MSPKTFAVSSSSTGGGGTPAAPDTSIQFNDGGSFGGDTSLTWNKTTNTLTTERILLDPPSGGGSILTITQATESPYAIQFNNTLGGGTAGFWMADDDIIHLDALTGFRIDVNDPDEFHIEAHIKQVRNVATLGSSSSTVAVERFSSYDAIGGSATSTFFTGDWNEIDAGFGGEAILGVITGRVDNLFIDGSGSNSNTFATYHSLLEANIGTGFTQTTGPTGQFFLSDWQIYGPVAVQPKILQGLMVVMANQFNGAPSGAPSNGMLFITNKGIGDGSSGHVSADTFPIDSAIQIHGYSTASAIDGIGWTTGIEIGGSGSPWLETKSIIGTGIHIRDYTTSGITIDNPIGSPTTSISVDGLILADTFRPLTNYKSVDNTAGATGTDSIGNVFKNGLNTTVGSGASGATRSFAYFMGS